MRWNEAVVTVVRFGTSTQNNAGAFVDILASKTGRE